MPDCTHYTVDLGVCSDRKMLFNNRFLISEAMEKEKIFLSKATRFFSAVKSAGDDINRLSSETVNAEKVERFVSRFIKRELGLVPDSVEQYVKELPGTDTAKEGYLQLLPHVHDTDGFFFARFKKPV